MLSVLPFLVSTPASAQTPSLGRAAGFAVLAASRVTNTGPSIIAGDVGVAPGTLVTGFPPGVVVGTIHAGDPPAMLAQGDVTIAYNALAGAACTTDLTGRDLGGRTLTPGVYCFSSAAQLTGTLTLDALGSPTARFIFQIASTLTTATGSTVNLINGACACNVFWQVGSSATLGNGTAFAGNVIAAESITMVTGTSLLGRALARTAAVTLDANRVTLPPEAIAAWSNYGSGWPGTAGVPSLVLSAPPVIGTSPNLVVQNVRGPETVGLILFGTGQVSIPTTFGGSILVLPRFTAVSVIPPGSLVMPLSIPLDALLVCTTVDVQVLEFDQGASHGLAFTRGLHIMIGR